ncbi:MAG: hypothetical protein IPG57_25470 [Burkholderiales bacterium]|nr:hypothetical protein [Burkholderiales bacterium]
MKATKEFTRRPRSSTKSYLPVGTTDFTPGLQRIIDKLGTSRARSTSPVGWAGAPTPLPGKIAGLDLEKRYGIKLARRRAASCRRWWRTSTPGKEGALYYYLSIPKNPVNEVARWPTTTASSRHRRTSPPPAA